MGFRACLALSAGRELQATGKTRGIVRSLAHTSSSSGGSSSVIERHCSNIEVVVVLVVVM